MYKKVLSTHMVAKYNMLPLTLKIAHANFAVLTEEFDMNESIIGAVSATVYDDILDYDTDDVAYNLREGILLMLKAIDFMMEVKFEYNGIETQMVIRDELKRLTHDNTYCNELLANATIKMEERFG